MDISEAIRKLKAVMFALNKLEVRGRENLDILLGSIQAIEQSVNVIEMSLQQMAPPEQDIPSVQIGEAPDQ